MLKRQIALLLALVMLTAALSSCSFLTKLNIFEDESVIETLESIFADSKSDKEK